MRARPTPGPSPPPGTCPGRLGSTSAQIGRACSPIAELATQQDGVVSAEQLRRLGFTAARIRSWVRSGRLYAIWPGVFAVGHGALHERGQLRAAVLAAGAPGGLSHIASAFHRGLLRRFPATIDVSVLGRPRPGTRPGIRIHRPRRLYADDIEEVDGLPCVSLGRTLVDVSCLYPHLLEPVARQAEYKRLLTPVTALAIVETTRGLNGAPAVRELLATTALDAADLESGLERDVARLLTTGGVAPPFRQHPFDLRPDHGRVVVDFWYPQAGLVVEADGPHHELPLQRAQDRRRDAALGRRGIAVQRVPYTVVESTPWEVAPAIAAALAERLGSQSDHRWRSDSPIRSRV